MTAEVIEHRDRGMRTVRLSDEGLIDDFGQVPLPPYIHTPLAESQRYQTVYAMINGSVAAPTAGLHFTQGLLEKLQHKGIQFGFVTLHIGLDTFRPIQVDDPSLHPIHTEYGEISEDTVTLINKTKQAGRRVIPVGTSTVRLLEAASQTGNLVPFHDWVDLFIMPGYQFLISDAMITNFHLPRSTLLLLVSAFAGRDLILHSYEQARDLNYRFYSFGDCMFIS
jgi:S-adenosylmethionine:tRNA ribosyltransferase-isomerase